MNDPLDNWTARLRDLTGEADPDSAESFVHDLYTAAQDDLDAERAEVEFEREE